MLLQPSCEVSLGLGIGQAVLYCSGPKDAVDEIGKQGDIPHNSLTYLRTYQEQLCKGQMLYFKWARNVC